MEKGVRFQVTLVPDVAEKLDQYRKKMGISRSAAISLAINEIWKEEHADKK